MDIKQVMRQFPLLSPEVIKLMRESEELFNPTQGMTGLDAHIYKSEEIIAQFYAPMISEETSDPYDRVLELEDEHIYRTGRNYGGKVLTRAHKLNSN
jgi:hypothetical protein